MYYRLNDTNLKKRTTSDTNILAIISPAPLPTLSRKDIKNFFSPQVPPITELQEHSTTVEFVLCFMSLCLEAFPCITVGEKFFLTQYSSYLIIPKLLRNAKFLSIYNSASLEISLTKRNLVNKCMSHRNFTVLLLPLI